MPSARSDGNSNCFSFSSPLSDVISDCFSFASAPCDNIFFHGKLKTKLPIKLP